MDKEKKLSEGRLQEGNRKIIKEKLLRHTVQKIKYNALYVHCLNLKVKL